MIHAENREGYTEFNIDPDRWKNRKPGLSAMVRLGDEDEWVGYCIKSILPWFDEIVCVLNDSQDDTEEIVRSFDSPKITVYQYPFRHWPNGDGFKDQPANSIHSKTYYANWALSLTSHVWVAQWDGDMVAQDWLGAKTHTLIESGKIDAIYLQGINIVHGLQYMSKAQPVIRESQPRFYRVRPEVHYVNGLKTNILIGLTKRFYKADTPDYLHFKWAKRKESAHRWWPENWKEMPHFQSIEGRVEPGDRYNGPIPSALEGLMG